MQVGFEYVVMTSHVVYDDCICVGYVYRRVIGRERVVRYDHACVRVYIYTYVFGRDYQIHAEIILLLLLFYGLFHSTMKHHPTVTQCVQVCVVCGRERVETSSSKVSSFCLFYSHAFKKSVSSSHIGPNNVRMPMTIYYGGCFVLLTKSSDEFFFFRRYQ